MTSPVQISIVMPCLNEAETLEACVRKAHAGLASTGLAGEVVVADNGSTDGSPEIAEKNGARVVHVTEKGYGNALRGGIAGSHGQWIIMGDADDSYDFSNIKGIVDNLQRGDDLVMGCRLPSGGGTIMPGAMPWKNRWIGNPSLSFLGRLFFRAPVRDFHCGLRGFSRSAYERMNVRTTGMEFASEIVMKSCLKGMKISEVPITLHKDGRSRPPHLRPWRDGWRHLRFMLIYSPRWLFLVPGLALTILGAIVSAIVFVSPVYIGSARLDAGTLLVAGASVVIGLQLVSFAFFTKVFGVAEQLLPPNESFGRLFNVFSLEKGLIAGGALLFGGLGLLIWAVWAWQQAAFGELPYEENLRRIIGGVTLSMVGVQVIAASFFLSVLGLKTTSRTPPAS